MFRAVIPARYGSTRLPGKPLLDLGGRPMIQLVHERVLASGAAEVVIATDDERIRAAALGFGAEVQMTSAAHASGTDRLAEVALRRGWQEQDVVVNVQGDEPLLPPALVRQCAALLAADAGADIATLATPIESLEEFLDPAVVKLVRRADGRALYFSRAPIPWHRDGAVGGLATQGEFRGALRHLGLYAYRVGALNAWQSPCHRRSSRPRNWSSCARCSLAWGSSSARRWSGRGPAWTPHMTWRGCARCWRQARERAPPARRALPRGGDQPPRP
jgi:3-deoxy-manno-octulosonate cytidylyltransferase (CMP-KDO synthetase)